MCYTPQKTCPSTTQDACSGNGTCTFYKINTGKTVDDCRVGDWTCKALCLCDEGTYSQLCSLNESQRDHVISQRDTILDGLDLLINNEDENEATVKGWSTGLYDSTGSDPTLLSSSQTEAITESVEFILESSRIVGLTSADALLSSLEVCAQSTTVLGVSPTNDTLSSNDTISISNSSQQQRNTLLSYGYLLTSNSLVPGQEAIETVSEYFRVRSHITVAGNAMQFGVPTPSTH